MNTIIILLSTAAYFFIGGMLNGFLSDRKDDDSVVAVFIWPIIIFIWLGDEFGILIRKRFNK